MRVLLVTDAWYPQVNGVVRTLNRVKDESAALGHDIQIVSPDLFRTIPCPSYSEIRLVLRPGPKLRKIVGSFKPDAIHIATEGPLGLAARRLCLKRGYPFTTAFHTRFPDYIEARWGVPARWIFVWLRWFHRPSSSVMVATRSLYDELSEKGFQNLKMWSRGVDTVLFRPHEKKTLQYPRPIFLYVGRVAIEKNLDAFCALDLPGSKLVVGDGPQRAILEKKYPDVIFVGTKKGEDLVRHFAESDVFVFPSRTDTFGLVMLEAMACGLPVAAFPVPGPLDVVNGHEVGVLSDDLALAARQALKIPPDRCRSYAESFSWKNVACQFIGNLQAFS